MRKRIKSLSALLLTFVMLFTTFSTAMEENSDYRGHWAKENIEKWVKEGIVSGYPDGSFRPNKSVTRAEFIAIVNNLFGFVDEKRDSFSDIPADAWYSEAVNRAAAAEIVTGSEGEFRPGDPVSRQEAAAILFNAFKLSGKSSSADRFEDSDEISDWSRLQIGVLLDRGFLGGRSGNVFAPSAGLTRAEAITLIENMTSRGNIFIRKGRTVPENITVEGDIFLAPGISGAEIALKGIDIKGRLVIMAKDIKIKVEDKTKISNVYIIKSASGASLDIKSGSKINEVVLDAPAKFTGEGTISSVVSNVAGSLFETQPLEITGTYSVLEKDSQGFFAAGSEKTSEPSPIPEEETSTSGSGGGSPTVPKSSAKDIISSGIGILSSSEISDILPGTKAGALKAALTVSDKAKAEILVSSGGTAVLDQENTEITETMKIQVTAEDASKKEYSLKLMFADGQGTQEDPYQVATAYHLNNVRRYLDAYYVQTADINLGVPPWNEGEGWNPIGDDKDYPDYGNPFSGIYDGQNHTISGLTINRPDEYDIGLFGYMTGKVENYELIHQSEVKNLKLDNISITGKQKVGSIAGQNYYNSKIIDCEATGIDIRYSESFYDLFGGLAGRNNGIISDSYAEGTIAGTTMVGGISGTNSGSITRSSADVEISGQGWLGGLTGGTGSGTIDSCHASGNITGWYGMGGLVGNASSSTISNSYATGNVTSHTRTRDFYLGGLVGMIGTQLTVVNSYSTGTPSYIAEPSGPLYIGGMAGKLPDAGVQPVFTSCYYDSDTSAQSDSGKGTPKTTAEMKSQATYSGWDFEDVWGINPSENGGYPFLRWQDFETGSPAPVAVTGVELSQTTIQLITGGETQSLSATVLPADADNKDIVWTSGDNSVVTVSDSGMVTPVSAGTATISATTVDGGFTAECEVTVTASDFSAGAGTESSPYQITTAQQLDKVRNHLDKHFVLKNDIDIEGYDNWLPIGDIYGVAFSGSFDGKGHSITNLKITTSNGLRTFGLFGYAVDAEIKNLRVENASVTPSWSYEQQVGILAGYTARTTVTDCSTSGTVSGSATYISAFHVGGLLGQIVDSTVVESCYSTAAIVGEGSGLIDDIQPGASVRDCYSAGSVSSGGGFAGSIMGTVENCYTISSVSSGNLFANYSGGLTTGCYYQNAAGGPTAVGSGSESGINGADEVEMKSQATYSGWNFEEVWGMNPAENNGYPFLRWQGYDHIAPETAELIAHWQFDEGTGDIAHDSSGNDNDGTITGGLTQDDYWADDRGSNSNRALALFEGQWMDIPDSVKADEMSFSSWIYITGTDGSAAPILSAEKGLGGTGFAYRLQITPDSHLRFEAIAPYTAGGARVSTSPDAMNMNQWYHVAATYDGISTRIYIDGELVQQDFHGSYKAINTAADIPVAVGHLQGWGVQWFRGYIDDARIYDGVLSPQEIRDLAEA